MKRTPTALVGAALMAVTAAALAVPATPAYAGQEPGVTAGGITYTVPVSAGVVAGECTITADRWTADYGPTHVSAVATSPVGAVWTRIRCTVDKGGTRWVDQEAFEYGPYAVIDAGDGTIPVEDVTVCAEVESQLTVDARPSARSCHTF